MTKIEQAFKLFDDYNKQDPTVKYWEGQQYPSQYFYALQLYKWILKLEASPSEALLLASRSQHIGRWESPRTSYPEGKAGYFRWRTELAQFHAKKAEEILLTIHYNVDIVERVKHIILKKEIKLDKDVQTMEDGLCLVFLQFQYDDFLADHDESKMIRIIQKTWNKMSDNGRGEALKLVFSDRGKSLILKALEH